MHIYISHRRLLHLRHRFCSPLLLVFKCIPTEKLAKEADKLPYPYPYLTPTHALPLAWPCP